MLSELNPWAKPLSNTPITGGLLLAKIYEEAGLSPVIGPIINESQLNGLLKHIQEVRNEGATAGRAGGGSILLG